MARPAHFRSLRAAALAAGAALFLLMGCAASLPTHPDDLFGHRFEDFAGGRETIRIDPPDPEEDYFIYPVIIDSVHVRQGFLDPEIPEELQTVPVEVLVKGSFPDSCMELHELSRQRFASLIRVELTMRRPRRVRCERMVRPYRFYFELEGRYAVGHYSLTINGRPYPFQVRPLAAR